MPTIYLDRGPAYGVGFIVTAGNSRLPDYLEPFTEQFETIAASLKRDHAKVAVLETVRIPDDRRRGEGFGTQILDEFKARCRAEGVSAVLLVADLDEEQRPGFDLEGWYTRNGFGRVLSTRNGPLYVFPESAAERLTAATALLA